MANLARFSISGSPSSEGGYDADPSEVLSLALESSSSLVFSVSYEVYSAAAGAPRKTTGAPSLTLTAGGVTAAAVNAARPNWTATAQGFPAIIAAHLWEIRCTVNGGTNQDGSSNPDFVFSRYVAMRSALNLRKLLPVERGEYDSVEYWASCINEIVDALGGSLGSKRWHTLADITFADEPDLTISSDGSFVIGGVTFTLRNSARFLSGGLGLQNLNAGSSPYPGLRLGSPDTAGMTRYRDNPHSEMPIVSVPLSQWSPIVRDVPVRFSIRTGYSLIPGTGGNWRSSLTGAFSGNDAIPAWSGVYGNVPSAVGQWFATFQGFWGQFAQTDETPERSVPTTIDSMGVVYPDGVGVCKRCHTYHGDDLTWDRMVQSSVIVAPFADQLLNVPPVDDPSLWQIEMCGVPNVLHTGAWLLWKRLLIQAYY